MSRVKNNIYFKISSFYSIRRIGILSKDKGTETYDNDHLQTNNYMYDIQ